RVVLVHVTPLLAFLPASPVLFCRPCSPRALPSFPTRRSSDLGEGGHREQQRPRRVRLLVEEGSQGQRHGEVPGRVDEDHLGEEVDRKSTRLNSSHVKISYAVFCLKKKNSRPESARRCPGSRLS